MKMKLNRNRILHLSAAVMLIIPVVLYCLKFGITITNDHERWAQAGSAFAGIYAPILGWLTILVLFNQLELQRQLTKHQFDQAHITEVKAEFRRALERISQILLIKNHPSMNIGQIIEGNFAKSTLQELAAQEKIEHAQKLMLMTTNLYGLWLQISSIFAGLEAEKGSPYTNAVANLTLLAISELGYIRCVALENAHIAVAGGKLTTAGYQFSPHRFHKSG